MCGEHDLWLGFVAGMTWVMLWEVALYGWGGK
jgi:hypothetical protein